MIKKINVFIIFLILFNLTGYLSVVAQYDPEITSDELRGSIDYLASDHMEGRYPGTIESGKAAKYIATMFQEAGLDIAGSPYQIFDEVTGIELGENSLITGETLWTVEKDYIPFNFSASTKITGEVIFCGYGFDIESDDLVWQDYSGVDVSDKWVLVFRGSPENDSAAGMLRAYNSDRDKALIARDKGAAGILMVSGYEYDTTDILATLYWDKSRSDVGIPAFNISRKVAESIFKNTGHGLKDLETILSDSLRPFSFGTGVTAQGLSGIRQINSTLRNVYAEVRGNDDKRNDEYIIVGAHFDHLGFGGPGSGSRSFELNKIHHGADDNASGVAAVIELAQKVAASKDDMKRSVMFVAFDGEEMGLLGSKKFVQRMPMDKSLVSAMINFDMVGRLSEDSLLFIGGTGTSQEGEEILNELNMGRFKLSLSTDGYGPSDHASFYAADIPVFFLSTGAHADYHTPNDIAFYINYEGEKRIVEYAYDLIMELANRKNLLTYQEAGPKERKKAGYDFKVTLGIMPDFTSSSNEGLRVDGVREGGPAYGGGMLKGDIIVAIEGKEILNIYDYMARLKQLSPGQIITVDVMRNGNEEVLIVQL